LGLAGDAAQAAPLVGDLAKRFPEDTIVQSNYPPRIHAASAPRGGSARKAIEALAPAARHELGSAGQSVSIALYPIYLRGEVYLAALEGSGAAAEFQKILDHPGVVQNEPIGALAHLGLARAYALTGESFKNRAVYQNFFAVWKNADPDISILIAANSEYAKIKSLGCALT
jgi:hypothetical protein